MFNYSFNFQPNTITYIGGYRCSGKKTFIQNKLYNDIKEIISNVVFITNNNNIELNISYTKAEIKDFDTIIDSYKYEYTTNNTNSLIIIDGNNYKIQLCDVEKLNDLKNYGISLIIFEDNITLYNEQIRNLFDYFVVAYTRNHNSIKYVYEKYFNSSFLTFSDFLETIATSYIYDFFIKTKNDNQIGVYRHKHNVSNSNINVNINVNKNNNYNNNDLVDILQEINEITDKLEILKNKLSEYITKI